MRKILLVLLLLLSCTACANILPLQEVISFDHIEELDNKFNYQQTSSRRNYLEAEYSYLNRSDLVTIVSEDDRYYYFNDNNLLLGIDKRYLRDPNEELMEGFEGYTRAGSNLYPDLNLRTNESIHTFEKNDLVNVIDEIEDTYYVEFEGTYGFMYKTQVSKTRIVTYIAPKPVEVPTTSDDSGSHGGGGGGGGGSSAPAESSGDGQDISLSFNNDYIRNSFLNNDLNMEMIVLIYNCPAYIHVYDREEDIKFIDEDDETLYVLVNGYRANVIKNHTALADEYEQWDGYTYGGSDVYYEYYLENVLTTNSKNDEVHVIDEIGKVCIVELEDGTIGYMLREDISTKWIVTYVAPKPVEVPSTSDDSGSHGGGGGGGGGGSSAPVWTPPIL